MKTLLFFLLLLAEIPQGLYTQHTSKERVDSAYNASLNKAQEIYKGDIGPGADFLMADWAFGENMLNLSAYFIEKSIDGKISDESLKADCLSLGSNVFRMKGDLTSAIKYAEECLDIDRMQENQKNISSSLNNIASLYLMHGDAPKAKKYIDEALEIESKLNRSSYLAIRYGVASEIYLKLGEKEKALEYSNKALSLDSLDNRINKVAVRRSQKASVLMELGKFNEAESELDKALPIFINQNNHNSMAITYSQLGEISAIKGNIAEAEDSFNKAIGICRQINHIYVESRAIKGLYKLYRERNSQKALSYLEEYVELLNNLHDKESNELFESFSVKYDNLKKEQTIHLQRGKIIWTNSIAVLLAILLILICILLYYSKKTIKLTNQRNSALIKANLDKDRLLAIAQSNIPREISNEILSITSTTEKAPIIKLTKREHEIANFCAKGLLNKEIAEKLNISQRTVETHKNNLFKKLGINNSIELMRYINMVNNEGETVN